MLWKAPSDWVHIDGVSGGASQINVHAGRYTAIRGINNWHYYVGMFNTSRRMNEEPKLRVDFAQVPPFDWDPKARFEALRIQLRLGFQEIINKKPRIDRLDWTPTQVEWLVWWGADFIAHDSFFRYWGSMPPTSCSDRTGLV